MSHSIQHLPVGSKLNYRLATWVVEEIVDYDWGENGKSLEYVISSGENFSYLGVEENGELNLDISSDLSMNTLKVFKRAIVDGQEPNETLMIEARKYTLSDKFEGKSMSRDTNDECWRPCEVWMYTDEIDQYYISIVRWSKTDFSAVQGQFIDEFQLTSIEQP